MKLDSKARKKLDDLLEMNQANYDEMSERWTDLKSNLLSSAKKSQDFRLGYVFGKMEHKFVSWFYSEYGRSQTDQEYEEFSDIVLDQVLRIEKFM